MRALRDKGRKLGHGLRTDRQSYIPKAFLKNAGQAARPPAVRAEYVRKREHTKTPPTQSRAGGVFIRTRTQRSRAARNRQSKDETNGLGRVMVSSVTRPKLSVMRMVTGDVAEEALAEKSLRTGAGYPGLSIVS